MPSKTVVERIALIIATLVAIIFIVLYFRKEPVIYDQEFIDARYEYLDSTYQVTLGELNDIKKQNKKRDAYIDSLETLKPKVTYVYLEKSKEIDSAHSNAIVNEFSDIFTNNGIE
jgi:spore coat polysaccharide biosynthesis protein SpsF (cytidylyltransferase family)